MPTRIGLTGDVMLGRLVDDAQRRRPTRAVWGDVLDRLRGLDGLVINLECCLSTRGARWGGGERAFYFRADPEWAVPALAEVGVDVCALANNHVLDFGEPALRDTLEHLDEADIAHAGAGRTREAAFAPSHVTVSGLDLAVVSVTDNAPEYAATDSSPGTARIDIDVADPETRSAMEGAIGRALSRTPDILVASIHWGPNMTTAPPDGFRAFARWLVDEGVDVVHGHSAHVFHGVEVYQERPILYDTGDFVDDYAVDDRLRNDRSFLFEVTVGAGSDPKSLQLVPVEIADRAVSLARPAAAEWSRDRMRELSAEFGTSFDRDGEHLVLDLAG